ncbi:MAG: YicC/YloC family endoribonuclease [Candidatus Omnitrophota bacterium]
MIKSMTGFGKGEETSRLGSFTVEIRTVNHRYFDLSTRIPASFSQLEEHLKAYIHSFVKRGKVNCSVSIKKNGKDFDFVRLDEKAMKNYYKILLNMKNKLKLKDDIKLSHILSFPDVIVHEQKEENIISTWPVLQRALKRAILECNIMRIKEGRAIFKDLQKRIAKISNNINNIANASAGIVSMHKERMKSKIEDMIKGVGVDRSRLETELALFARQSDVTEEIVRSKSHLLSLNKAINSDQESGRKLDFLLQELQREVNTLGSKIGYSKISRVVVDIKGEIEKMREQVQNVE